TTMPSPHRAWWTRSPSRNWRSPGMMGRGARTRAGAAVSPANDPDRAPPANASRRAARSRLGRNGSPRCGAPGRPLPCRYAPPRDEHDRELEALRRVERDQGRGILAALIAVLVGDQRRLLEQPVERVLGRQVVVAGRHRTQLEQVGPALLALLRPVRQHRPVA